MPDDAPQIEDARRIRRTWAKAAGGGEMVGTLFYARLFEIAPETRPMFDEDVSAQARKLMTTLNWIVDHLDAPETLEPQAAALAVRHVRYGVRADHYPAVGRALIETLETGLGGGFAPEDAAAWGRVYRGLSALMIEAAYPGPAKARGPGGGAIPPADQ